MSFETCEWFNKEKIKLSSKIPYFDVIKEKVDSCFFNDIVHYKSNDETIQHKTTFRKLKITDNEKKLKCKNVRLLNLKHHSRDFVKNNFSFPAIIN